MLASLHRLRDRSIVATKPRRVWALLRVRLPLRSGWTVVIVSWNSLELVQVSVGALKRFSPAARIIIVDNGSVDGSVSWLRGQSGVKVVALATNVGHGPALDIGFLAARTTYVAALDVDAFPLSGDWLPELERRLVAGARVAGAHGGEVLDAYAIEEVPPEWRGRDFVHPCCLAMATRRFVMLGRTFRKATGLDAGEQISMAERPHLSYLEPTSVVGPGVLGTVFGEMVYHNFYGTRHRKEGTVTVDGVTADMARQVWGQSVTRYLS